MTAPKIRLLYYKNIVEESFRNFFSDCENYFAKDSVGRYVLTDYPVLERYMRKQILSVVCKYVRPFDIINPEYTFIIGGCFPADNMLLNYRTKYFPTKLLNTLETNCPRYVLKEKDIIVDMFEFDKITDKFFSTVFSNGFCSILGSEYTNVFAVKHKRLDCYSMFKALKYIFGRQNCVNVWKDEMNCPKQCITAVNDLIDLYVNNKTAMNKSKEFQMIVKELKQYMDECLMGVGNG